MPLRNGTNRHEHMLIQAGWGQNQSCALTRIGSLYREMTQLSSGSEKTHKEQGRPEPGESSGPCGPWGMNMFSLGMMTGAVVTIVILSSLNVYYSSVVSTSTWTPRKVQILRMVPFPYRPCGLVDKEKLAWSRMLNVPTTHQIIATIFKGPCENLTFDRNKTAHKEQVTVDAVLASLRMPSPASFEGRLNCNLSAFTAVQETGVIWMWFTCISPPLPRGAVCNQTVTTKVFIYPASPTKHILWQKCSYVNRDGALEFTTMVRREISQMEFKMLGWE